MTDVLSLKPQGLVRGRPFAKGGHPAGRRAGSRNKKTLAAAVWLEGEAEALTRRAVELALAGDPTAMRLCIERILPPCRERAVRFALPPIESAPTGQARGLKAHDIAAAMKAVTSALAAGVITPGEAGTIAAELSMPDLDLIKQGEQGVGPSRAVREGPVGQSRRPAARLVVHTSVRAIETSDVERRLKIVEADLPARPADVLGRSDARNAGYSIYG